MWPLACAPCMDETSSYSTASPLRVDILEKVPPARLLALLGGSCAVVLGVLMFAFQMASGPLDGPLGLYGKTPVVMMLLVNLLFGAMLLVAYTQMASRERDWAVLVIAFSLVLIVLGGIAGAAGGILGLVSGVFVFAQKHPALGVGATSEGPLPREG